MNTVINGGATGNGPSKKAWYSNTISLSGIRQLVTPSSKRSSAANPNNSNNNSSSTNAVQKQAAVGMGQTQNLGANKQFQNVIKRIRDQQQHNYH